VLKIARMRLEFFENNSTVIRRLGGLQLFALCRPQHYESTPEILAGIVWYRKSGFCHTKAPISLKRGKKGPRLLLRTYALLLGAKSVTLDDLEGS